MTKNIPNIKVPIIKNGITYISSLKEEFKNKKIVFFGVPGAFTPTCSEKHLPDYIKSINLFEKKGIFNIYCLAVNDEHVMKAWLLSHSNSEKIIGIADGNAEITKYYNLLTDKLKNFMGYRSARFAMYINNSLIKSLKIEEPGELRVSSAENMILEI